MKLVALAAALVLSGPAFAQDTPQQSSNTTQNSSTMQPGEQPGGYAPTAPLFSQTPPPGAKIVFVPNTQTPTEAFPPPPPRAHYPLCKRGQYDECRQRGG